MIRGVFNKTFNFSSSGIYLGEFFQAIFAPTDITMVSPVFTKLHEEQNLPRIKVISYRVIFEST